MNTPAKRSFGETMTAVAWSFIGLRRRSDYERDATALKPAYVIGAALIGVSMFIGVLLTAVRIATS
ncbi:DUF2970 domain-containing protein [Pseudoduganella sp. RAF53_2]|uniref:DUF2970 domain-containing protein n=1 Tax=unclassified Pseudoduganella TaxID=2637179 RepID=UPI003F94B265